MGTSLIPWEEAQLKIEQAQQKMGGRHGTAQELLKHNAAVNKRHVDVAQAMAVSFYAHLQDNICKHIKDPLLRASRYDPIERIEQNQMAIADKEDARNEFIEAKVAEAMKANMGKGGANLSISTDSGGSEGDS
jgi:hypothetical protein